MIPTVDLDRPDPLAVIVMGVSGCGKSTLAVLLAQAMSCPFLEGDAYHSPEAIEKMQSGQALTDDDRWPWLDRLGRATADAATSSGVAVATCSALRSVYRDRLRATIGSGTCFVLLDSSREQLLRRLTSRTDHYMPASLLDSQLATLERPSASECALSLDADAAPSLLRDTALSWLAQRAGRPH